MLDMALATFNKLPLTEDMKLVYLNLGLDYENRGQRDKAFLVYKKVFDVDPGFEDVAQRMERLSQAGAGRACSGRPRALSGTAPSTGASHPGAGESRSLAARLPGDARRGVPRAMPTELAPPPSGADASPAAPHGHRPPPRSPRGGADTRPCRPPAWARRAAA